LKGFFCIYNFDNNLFKGYFILTQLQVLFQSYLEVKTLFYLFVYLLRFCIHPAK